MNTIYIILAFTILAAYLFYLSAIVIEKEDLGFSLLNEYISYILLVVAIMIYLGAKADGLI